MKNNRFGNLRNRGQVTAAILGLALAATVGAAQAATYNITFDPGDTIGGLTSGATLSNQYTAATGATFAANPFSGTSTQPGTGGTWATNTDMTVTSTDLNGTATAPASGNILHAYSNGWVNETGDPSFRLSFATPISTLSAVFFSINNTYVLADKLYAYSGSTLLATTSAVTGAGTVQTLTVASGTPITSVIFTAGSYSDWVGVDNISFTTVTAAVPEPSTVAAMALGGLGLGVIVRRKRARA